MVDFFLQTGLMLRPLREVLDSPLARGSALTDPSGSLLEVHEFDDSYTLAWQIVHFPLGTCTLSIKVLTDIVTYAWSLNADPSTQTNVLSIAMLVPRLDKLVRTVTKYSLHANDLFSLGSATEYLFRAIYSSTSISTFVIEIPQITQGTGSTSCQIWSDGPASQRNVWQMGITVDRKTPLPSSALRLIARTSKLPRNAVRREMLEQLLGIHFRD